MKIDKQPVFSVVIPTYNRAGFIRDTIDSVLAQTFSDLEVIVVDDGSTDNTAEVVGAVDDPRFRYVQKENEERAKARNAGADLAGGEYVTFLDSDDLILNDHLAAAAEVIRQYDRPEVFHLGFRIEDLTGRVLDVVDALPQTVNDLLIDGNRLSCNGVFLRKDIAVKHPFNPDRGLSGTEDYELWLRMASRYPIYCDNRVTSIINQHDDRSVVTTDRQKLEARIGLLEKYLLEDKAFVEKFGGQVRKFKASNRVYIALHLALAKNARLGALSYLIQAMAQSPSALRQRAFYGTLKRLFI